jgi:ferredoxin
VGAHNGHAVNLAQILPETIRQHNQADAINSAAILVPENRNRCPRSKSKEALSVAVRLFQNTADKLSKQLENAPGPWYVDTSCALCRLCLEEATILLNYNHDETAVHFFRQPETPEEMAAAQRAMDVCPTLTIGNDG